MGLCLFIVWNDMIVFAEPVESPVLDYRVECGAKARRVAFCLAQPGTFDALCKTITSILANPSWTPISSLRHRPK